MFVENKTTIIKQEILTYIARFALEGRLLEDVDKIPVSVVPRDANPIRCCIYKDREMVKYRTIALLGFSLENEFEIEKRLLSDYVRIAYEREKPAFPILTFINDACRTCVRANYIVTNICQNCVARPCIVNCPKDAISTRNEQSYIDPDKCINCGKCMEVCPYHAIVYLPVPCEEACPVDAIRKDETGKEHIDYTRCIFCGKCTRECPFGAIMEKSQLLDVIKHIRAGRKTVAMIAPSIAGQFKAPMAKVIGALKESGFAHVAEVALGADRTIREESEEFLERMKRGDPCMGTSCCPAYVEAVKKHAKSFLPYVSKAETPMAYTGRMTGEKYPGAVRVFIGPCVAKKHEDLENRDVDYVLTYEEMESFFAAKDINVNNCKESEFDLGGASREGRGFPVSSGVADAITLTVKDKAEVKTVLINGLTRQTIKQLQRAGKGETEGNLIEVMSCEGGCLSGPAVITNPKSAVRRLKEFLESGE